MNRLTTLSVLVLFFCSCSKKPEQSNLTDSNTQNTNMQKAVSNPTSEDTTAVAKVTEKPKVVEPEPAVEKEKKAQEWLAQLADYKNNVNFRARTESIWKPVDSGMGFIRFDALQTQASSNAKVMYKSGASLDVKQNTLLIFDYDPGKDKKNEDRVIMSKGELVGSTKTELWIFTKSGLVQIKSDTGKKAVARARVVVAGANKLNLKVEQGNAEVVYKKQNEFKRVKVVEKSEIELRDTSSIVDVENFNESKVVEQVRQVAQAETEVKKAVKAQIEIANLEDGIVVESASFEVKGKLTAEGGTLLINGDVTSLDQDLKFSKTLNLQAGVNLIVFQIVRSDGTVEFIRRNIRLKAN
jgi:cell envelope opacity-associated protein A